MYAPLEAPAGVSKRQQARAWPSVEAATRALKAVATASNKAQRDKRASQALSGYRRALLIDPRNIYASSGVADSLFILGRYEEAETAFRRAIALQPDDLRLQRSLGEIAIIRGNLRAAHALWRQVLAQALQAPKGLTSEYRFTANYRLAQIFVSTGRAAQAFPYFRAALGIQPKNAKVWAEYGEALSYTERGSAARGALNRAIGLAPKSVAPRVALANLLSWNADYSNAIVQYKKALVIEPANESAQVGLADALTYARRPDEAIPQYQRLLARKPGSAQARFGLGRALVFASRFEEAISPLRLAVRQQPSNIEALRLLALAQAGRDGSPSANASAALVTYRALLARQTRPEEQALTLASIGDLENSQNNITSARRAYENSLRLAPGNIEASNSLAQIFISQSNLGQARRVAEAALAREPGNVRARILQIVIENRAGNTDRALALSRPLEGIATPNAGDALQLAGALRDAGNPAAANRIIARLAASLPSNPTQALQIANAVRDSGAFEDSLPLYRRLIRSSPNNLQTRLELAEALTWSRRPSEARRELEFVLARQPNNLDARARFATVLVREQTPESLRLAQSQLASILAREPQNARARIALGELRTVQQNFSGSIQSYREVLEADPNNLRARLGLARNLYYSRQIEQAIAEYQQLLVLAPSSNQIKLELGQVYLDLNRLADAEALFDQVEAQRRAILPPLLDGKPTLNANAHISASLLPFQAALASGAQALGGPVLGAARIVGRAVPTTGKPRRYSVERILLAQASGSRPGALAQAPGAGATNPTNAANGNGTGATAPAGNSVPTGAGAVTSALSAPTQSGDVATQPGGVSEEAAALRGLGEVRRRQERFDEAIDYFNRALAVGPADAAGRRALGLEATDVLARLGLAQSLRGKGDNARALEEVERVRLAAPQSFAARALRIQLLSLVGRRPEAEADLQAIVAGLRQPNSGAVAENFQVISSIFVGLQNYDAALEVLAIGRERFPNAPVLRRVNAEALTFARRFPEARAAYDDLLAANPRDPDALLGRARVFNYSDALAEAEPAYRALLAVQPDNYQGQAELADVLQRNGSYAEAARIYRAVIERNGNDLQPRLQLGRVLRFQGELDQSDAELSAILAIDPRFAPALTERGLLRGQRGDYTRALADLDAALEIAPDTGATSLPTRALRAQMLALSGRREEAQTALGALVSTLEDPNGPARSEDFQVIASSFITLGNTNTALQVLAVGREKFPNAPILRRTNAEALTLARRFPEARAAYDELLAANPRDVEALLGRARVFNYSDALTEAAPAYRALLAVQPENYRGLVELANVLSRSGDYPESARLYRSAIERNATDLQPRLELGRVLRYQREFDQSEAVLTAVLGINPRYAPALVERGILRGQRGDFEPGLADLDAALEIAPDDLNTVFGLAEVQSYAGQFAKSIRNYRAGLARDPGNVKGRTELGLVLSYAGRHQEALRELGTVLQQAPQNVNAQIARASTLGRARRIDESVALYNTILQADPRNVRAQEGLADSLVLGRNYDQAVQIYDALIATSPNNQSYRISRGRALGYGKRTAEAAEALRAVVATDPQNPEARLALAEVLGNSERQPSRREAIVIYRSVLRDQPQNIPARIGLGRVLSYTGRYDEAETILSGVIREAPQNSEALLALAESQRFASRFFDARSTYSSVIKLDPTNPVAIEGLRLARQSSKSSFTIAGRRYSDTNGVRVTGAIFGPTFNTRAGQFGFTVEQGRFRDDNVSLKRQALNLLVARQVGPLAARLVLTRLKYGGNAPDKNLYDLSLGRNQGPRFRYFLGASRLDIFESAGAVLRGITADQQRAGVDFPLARKLDLELRYAHYNYSDSNRRDTVGASLLYRFKPTTPSLRVGLGYVRDNTDFFSPLYYTPQDYNAVSVLADYVVDRGPLRYGLFAQHPLTDETGASGRNRPADTLFGYANYDLSELVAVFVNGGIVRSPNFDSNDITAGITGRF